MTPAVIRLILKPTSTTLDNFHRCRNLLKHTADSQSLFDCITLPRFQGRHAALFSFSNSSLFLFAVAALVLGPPLLANGKVGYGVVIVVILSKVNVIV